MIAAATDGAPRHTDAFGGRDVVLGPSEDPTIATAPAVPERVTPPVLAALRRETARPLSVDTYRPETARLALEAGLDVELFSQYGLPGETKDDAFETLRFVQDCGVVVRGNSNAQQMQLYFGSAIIADPSAHGIHPLRSDLPPYLAPGDEFETDWMSRDDMNQVRATWSAASVDGGKRVVS